MAEVRDARPGDAPEIARIYNQGIEERSSTFETELRDADYFVRRLDDAEGAPLIVAEEDGRIVGWAGLSKYSERECYAGIGEASMYVDRAARGRHVGLELAQGLRAAAGDRGYWKIIGLLLSENVPSLAFVERTGARVVGTFRNHAQLDGEWRDVVVIEVLLREGST